MNIKVLGPGCAKCDRTEKIIRKLAASIDKEVSIEKVTDMMEIAGYGVMGTPAVVVDGELKISGRIPKEKEIMEWFG